MCSALLSGAMQGKPLLSFCRHYERWKILVARQEPTLNTAEGLCEKKKVDNHRSSYLGGDPFCFCILGKPSPSLRAVGAPGGRAAAATSATAAEISDAASGVSSNNNYSMDS